MKWRNDPRVGTDDLYDATTEPSAFDALLARLRAFAYRLLRGAR